MEIYKSEKTKNKIKGRVGEEQARTFLESNNYEILETNFTTKIGEIDIIAKQDNRIIFIEVKERATARFGYPREAVNLKKQQTIRNVADCYLKSHRLYNQLIRFDVIEILAGKITHLIAAF